MSGQTLACPYCSFFFKLVDFERRGRGRVQLKRSCELKGRGEAAAAETLNVSKSGLGVRLEGKNSFKIDDTLHIVVKDFDIESQVRVVWIKPYGDCMSRVGMRFC
jgi:hypothetical protein